MEMNRRDMMMAMTAFASLGGLMAEAQEKTAASADADLSHSRVFRFEELPVVHGSNGGWSRAVTHGTLPTGEFVELHQTMLPPGKMPHPPHQHRNSEFILIRQGKLEYLNEGKPEPAGVGDIIYTASNRMHGLKNVGDDDAMYFVVSISHGQM